jgi:hypothetical protein
MALPRVLATAAACLLVAGTAPSAQEDASRAGARATASYTLRVQLDPATRTLAGEGQLVWRNPSTAPAHELQLHLYWNAWRDPASSWLREQRLGRNAGLARRPAEDRGQIDLTRLALAGGGDLLAGAQFIAPDDGNADDRTVLRVPLGQPVAPGDVIRLDVAWTSRVPRTYARTGTIGDYYFIAQWFPKLGVLEERGWNTHQFHAATEFYSDFGSYDVTITVPSGWIVGATGREESRVDRDHGMVAHRYLQPDVHDFAWTTSPHFLDRRERFESAGLPPVDMRLLLQPEHQDQGDRHFAATRAALEHYGRWFGPYPYGQITIVDPVAIVNPRSQGESTGGMEYPTLFTAGTRWYAPWRGPQPESVTVHEAGHQWWYGVVATNEFEHAWMDEGLNTYATAHVLNEAYPNRFLAVERYFGGLVPWSYSDVPWTIGIEGFRRNPFRPVAGFDVQSKPTWKYWPGSASAMSYNKTALWLGTLERMLGWPTVQQILRAHFERGAFRHPAPDDFFAIASEVSGRDLRWFFDAVHRSAAVFDYGVAQVDGGTVVVRRYDDGVFPVKVRVTFDDGRSADVDWDGRDRWRAFTFPDTAGAIRSVDVDPDRVLLLDVNTTNNSWTAEPRAAEAARRWSLRWLTWLQELMLTYAFFA